jgi:hypothetical protein
MKRSAVPLAMLAAGVAAQDITTTITYSVCPTATTTTITLPTTITYCPGGFCNVTPSGGIAGTVTNTVTNTATTTSYITAFPCPCQNAPGLCSAQYTIWESCPCTKHGKGYIPKDFTTTLHKCDSCGDKGEPTEITMTVPCTDGAYAGHTPAATQAWKGPAPEIPIVNGKPVAPAEGQWADNSAAPVADASQQWADNGAAPTGKGAAPAPAPAAGSSWADSNAAPSSKPVAADESNWADNSAAPSQPVADYKGAANKAAFALSTVAAGLIGALALML